MVRNLVAGPFKDLTIGFIGSSAIYYADLANGKVDAVIECTRKNNLEIAIAFGLIREAGGVMLLADGSSIGPKQYKTFGQSEHLPVISAATKRLGKELVARLDL